MSRPRLIGKLLGLLLYVIWREWICGQDSSVRPWETVAILAKVIGGADLGGVS